MKRYEIKKARVCIAQLDMPVYDKYNAYNIIRYSEEIVKTMTEEEKKPLKILDATEFATLNVRKILGRDNIENLSFEEMRIVQNSMFKAYLIYDRKREEFIGYLEDFE